MLDLGAEPFRISNFVNYRLMKIFILEQATTCIWSHQILHVLWLLLKASRG